MLNLIPSVLQTVENDVDSASIDFHCVLTDVEMLFNSLDIYINNIYTDLDSVARLGRGTLEGEHDLEHVLGGVAGEVPGRHVPQRRLAVDLVRQHGRPEHLHSVHTLLCDNHINNQ